MLDNYIETYSGKKFYFQNPSHEDISIEDIAHSLSMQCRYTGHCKKFYSIAEHSIHVSCIVPPEYALEALMHDASEAYLTDVASPIKQVLSEYKIMEQNIERVIFEKYGLQYPFHESIKYADLQLLMLEAKQVMTYCEEWKVFDNVTLDDHDIRITCKIPEEAEYQFMNRFRQLQGERDGR